MVYAHVIYKRNNAERKVTVKAYNLLKSQYTLIGYVDEEGNPVQGPEERPSARTQKKSQAVEVAANKPVKKTPEEIAAKKAELQAINDAAIQKAKDEQKAEKAKAAAAKKAEAKKETPKQDAEV